ncbi:hypothetical protein LUZ61_007739 [Rhynchospora tenuis]|uniref:Uncharacterized protein n=1 Tax=Rhynchospora tenuis TaxID=198213 RepID=A0AAD6EWV7_9POAL|nr:hypothetical protein LUZ61_007739 [Rhynchospora tenuis]
MDNAHGANIKCSTLKEIDTPISKMDAQTVGPDHIAKVVSCCTGSPVARFGQNEMERLVGLADGILQRVVGQDKAVNAVARKILTSRSGFGGPQKLIGSFLLLGPTGVGKTELAKALAEQLFDDENLLIRINMSDYMEKDSIARLIGVPSGYVAGQLTEPVRRRPYSVILFDEVDKAHMAVCDMLLQVLINGRLTDGQGKTIDFANTIIIMTSNLGTEQLFTEMSDHISMNLSHSLVLQEVNKHFRAEFLNNIDKILILNPLSHDSIREVARRHMKNVVIRFAKRCIALHVTDAALDVIIASSDDHLYDARNIQRLIEERVTNQLADMFIREKIYENSTVYIEVDKEKHELVYRVENGGIVNPNTNHNY